MILEHLERNNLHHAYLLEGQPEEVMPELLNLMSVLKIKTLGNPDFFRMAVDSFKMEDANYLRSLSVEKGVSADKKIFVVSANNLLLEAQNTLLKMFEEPTENTHFFLIVPDSNILLPTLVSRFFLIRDYNQKNETTEAEKFISMALSERIDFIKDLLAETEDEEEEVVSLNSSRPRALKFLNALESVLHARFLSKTVFDTRFFSQIFKVREFLRQPGSSVKSLMESVALVIPVL